MSNPNYEAFLSQKLYEDGREYAAATGRTVAFGRDENGNGRLVETAPESEEEKLRVQQAALRSLAAEAQLIHGGDNDLTRQFNAEADQIRKKLIELGVEDPDATVKQWDQMAGQIQKLNEIVEDIKSLRTIATTDENWIKRSLACACQSVRERWKTETKGRTDGYDIQYLTWQEKVAFRQDTVMECLNELKKNQELLDGIGADPGHEKYREIDSYVIHLKKCYSEFEAYKAAAKHQDMLDAEKNEERLRFHKFAML